MAGASLKDLAKLSKTNGLQAASKMLYLLSYETPEWSPNIFQTILFVHPSKWHRAFLRSCSLKMTNVPLLDPHISYSPQFYAPILFPNTRPQRDYLFGFCCLHGETIVPIIGIPQRMIRFDALKSDDFAHEKADFRGLVHGMCKTDHLLVTCRAW